MAQPYIGEIRMFAGNFAPAGWALCDGQLAPIFENETLFQLIGTTYGGDGETTFALPDLRGRIPVHQGQGAGLSAYTLGETAGMEAVALTVEQLGAHSHQLQATDEDATQREPAAQVLARSIQAKVRPYLASTDASVALAASAVAPAGASQPHTNLQPYLCVNFIISLFGIFPTQA